MEARLDARCVLPTKSSSCSIIYQVGARSFVHREYVVLMAVKSRCSKRHPRWCLPGPMLVTEFQSCREGEAISSAEKTSNVRFAIEMGVSLSGEGLKQIKA